MAVAQNDYVDFDLLEVARRCGIQILKPTNNGQWIARCPFCGDSKNKRHGHLYLKPDTGEYKCHRCDAGGYTLGLYAVMRGIDNKTAYKELLNAANENVPEILLNRDNVISIVENPVAPLEKRHGVYTAMLELLPLYPLHLEDLLKRGLPKEAIKRNGYKSFPAIASLRWRICEALVSQHDLTGVPGFFVNKAGKWDMNPYPDGYFIPVRSRDGSIQGCQFRILPYDEEKHKGKYPWFSSLGKEQGTRATQWLHLAVPPGVEIKERIWLTEGALKADIASIYMRVPFVAIPGNSPVENVVSALKKLGVKEVVLAYDADQQINENVKEAVTKLDSGISSAGMQVIPAIWPTRMVKDKIVPKGIDDACMERVKRSLPVSEDVFVTLTETKTRRVTVSTPGGQSVMVEETVTRKCEIQGSPSTTVMQKLLKKINGLLNQ